MVRLVPPGAVYDEGRIERYSTFEHEPAETRGERDRFEAAGLRITFQDYVCRPYRQQFEPFMSHMSAIDLLLNEGPAGSELI